MRKGFTLIEILIVIIIIPFVWVALDGLFRTILSDIPRSYRVVQENTSLLSMLEQFHKDIDAAKELPESFAGHTADDELLLIKVTDGVIRYQLKDGQVLRHKVTNTQQGSAEQTKAWSTPHAKLKWHVWRKDANGYAVEVKTHIEHTVLGHQEKKMANSHLYFVGAFREALK